MITRFIHWFLSLFRTGRPAATMPASSDTVVPLLIPGISRNRAWATRNGAILRQSQAGYFLVRA